MKAVIKTGGKQYKVKLGQQIKIEKIDKKVGETVSFDDVLLVFDEDSDKVNIGAPILETKVEGKVIDQAKGKKVIIFKYKPKKRYKVKKGHRQLYTLVEILKIGDKSVAPKKIIKPVEKTEIEKKEPKKDEIKKGKVEAPEVIDEKKGFFE